MIKSFDNGTALLLIDVQKGVNNVLHWGGPTGRRNNPEAEARMRTLLQAWRGRGLPVIFTQHDSRQRVSPLKLADAGGAFIEGLEPHDEELVVRKDVNSAFIGTRLELELRRRAVTRLAVVGFFTNYCVETTVRTAGNMGFDTYLAHDCCATTNQVGVDGRDHDAELMHDIAVTSMNGEFCTALTAADMHSLLAGTRDDLHRVQRNE
jgi:nicotinamidase-related amidase